MEALIPLIIVAAGILVSAFKGNKEEKNAAPRNIDKGKLNNPNRPKTTSSRPTTQRSSNRESDRGGGIFGDLVGELERGFKEFQDEMNKSASDNSDKGMIERRRAQLDDAKQSSRRIAQDTYQRSRQHVEDEVDTIQDTINSRRDTISDVIDVGEVSTSRPERQRTERISIDRSSRNEKVSQRAAELRERNRAERSITRETAEQNRYRLDSDFVRTGEIGSYEFRVDRKTVLDGIIFSEILSKPKSRQ
ncbi:MAG TPA: hypothetical protein K8V35_03595 [Aliicoccus persicus]|uniref:Uncharacterized protein n=1 Tax=Aliicoccus persicus TaxID=930138 RepID=A0A921B5L5_9STAP|nr:hypothetical protein [Aliicoccus persicus]